MASNEAFLRWVFGPDKYERAHLCAFPDDPSLPSASSVWRGGPAKYWLTHAAAETNNYFVVSLFTGFERVKTDFEAMYVVGVDDIGTKVEADRARTLLGEPSYRIETSPGNEQWGYVLDKPISIQSVAEELQEKLVETLADKLGAVDPGQRGVTRYMRLPVGRNRKMALGLGPMGFKCRGMDGTVQPVVTADLIVAVSDAWDALKARSDPPGSGASGAPTAPPPPAAGDDLAGWILDYDPAEIDAADLVLGGLYTLGLVKSDRARWMAGLGMGWDVVCPWVYEHTNRADTGTAYGRGQGFRCHHGHCADRVGRDLWDRVNELIEDDSGGVDSLNLRAFGPGTAGYRSKGPDAAADDPADPADPKPTKAPRLAILDDMDEDALEARPWLAENYLLRGAVSLLVGPPDQGKSAWLTTAAVALVLGQGLGRMRPVSSQHTLRVLTLFAEEENHEQLRRLYAALRVYSATRGALGGRLGRLGAGRGATLFVLDGKAIKATPAWHALKAQVVAFRPDVLLLDPLIELHTLNENDNAQLKYVIGALRWLAQEYACAVLLTHHAGKGEVNPGDLNMARGASAIGGAVRIAMTLVEMTEAEADRLGVPKERRRYYVRLDQARNSRGLPAHAAEWFEKVSVTLANGDKAPACIPWTAPAPVAVTAALLDQLVTAIEAGCVDDDGRVRPWSPTLDFHQTRSIRNLLNRFGVDRISEAATVRSLKDGGRVAVARYGDPLATRGEFTGFRVVANNLPAADWRT